MFPYIGEFLGELSFSVFFLLSALAMLADGSRFPRWMGYLGVDDRVRAGLLRYPEAQAFGSRLSAADRREPRAVVLRCRDVVDDRHRAGNPLRQLLDRVLLLGRLDSALELDLTVVLIDVEVERA